VPKVRRGNTRERSGLVALRSAALDECLADARLDARDEKKKNVPTDLRSTTFEERSA
jgi:hypothetical protein